MSPKYTYLGLGVSRRPWPRMRPDVIKKIPSVELLGLRWPSGDLRHPEAHYSEREPVPMPPWAKGDWSVGGRGDVPLGVESAPPDDRGAWLPSRVGSLIYSIWGPMGIKWAKARIKEIV